MADNVVVFDGSLLLAFSDVQLVAFSRQAADCALALPIERQLIRQCQ
jgi:hypothetical protein